MVEPHNGSTYTQQRTAAWEVHDQGYTGFFRSDHFLHMDGNGLPGPTDAWATLAALATDVPDIRLGTLVSPVTFRAPGVLATLVAQVDQMSGGRVEVGLGAGWFADEHRAMGIPFPNAPTRFGMLDEQLDILTQWLGDDRASGEPLDYDGAYYAIDGAPCLPRPVQRNIPIIVGGNGSRSAHLAAHYASEYNVSFAPAAWVRARLDRMSDYCRLYGQQPGNTMRSSAVTLCMGRTDAEVVAMADHIQRPLEELREKSPLVGTPDQVLDQLQQWEDVTDVDRLYVQLLDMTQLDMLALLTDTLEQA